MHIHTQKEREYLILQKRRLMKATATWSPGPASIQSPDVVREKWLSLKTVQLHPRAIYFPLFGFLETGSHVLKLSTWLRMTLSFWSSCLCLLSNNRNVLLYDTSIWLAVLACSSRCPLSLLDYMCVMHVWCVFGCECQRVWNDSLELASWIYGLCPLSAMALGVLVSFGLLLCFVLSFFPTHTYWTLCCCPLSAGSAHFLVFSLLLGSDACWPFGVC